MKGIQLKVFGGAAAVVFVGLAVLSFFYISPIFENNVCGEKGIQFPAVSKSYSNTPMELDGEDVCDQIVGLEGEGADRTSCIVGEASAERGIGFVLVQRENLCRESGSRSPLRTNFYGVTFENFLYPLFDVGYYSNTPERETEFVDFEKGDFEKLAESLVVHGDEKLNFYIGQYIYYWTKSKDLTCYDLELPGVVQNHCFLSAAEDLYPDLESFSKPVESLLDEYGNCRALQLSDEYNYYHSPDIYAACAMYASAELGKVFDCFNAYFGEGEEEFSQRYQCVINSNYELTQDYCADLTEDKDESEQVFSFTQKRCYAALAWQSKDGDYCELISSMNESSEEYYEERCAEEVERIVGGE
jgi:hypothetical protein